MLAREPLRPFKFKVKQKKFIIADTTFGGMPGSRPTVLIGSLFYTGDKSVINHKEGIIDKKKVENSIRKAEEVAEKYSLPLAIDLVAYTSKAMENYLSFICDLTNAPIFLDGVEEEARVRAYQLAKELGLNHRVIGNAIYTHTKDDELMVIKENNIEAMVLMAFDAVNPASSLMPNDRIKILKENLLPKAEKANVKKPLVDVVVLDPASIALSSATISRIKEKYGLPTGCAPANALGSISKKTFGEEGAFGIQGGTAVFLQMSAADFIFYGPIGRIKYVAPAVAITDAYLGYLSRLEGERPPRKHPYNTLLRKIQRFFTGIEVW